MGLGERRVWMFKTGPATCADIPVGRPRVYLWTVPARGTKGDLVVLYATKPSSEFVGIGRMCSDPVRSRHRKLRDKKPQYWGWVQFLRLEHGVSLARARDNRRVGSWSALKNLAGSFAQVPEGPVLSGLRALLLTRNTVAKRQWERWASPGARYPRDLEPVNSRSVYWEPDEPEPLQEDHERFLQEKIRRLLIGSGEWRRHDPELDGFPLPVSGHVRLPGKRLGYADIVLVKRGRGKRLLVIEVKKYAVPRPNVNGIDQVEGYRAALEKVTPKPWTVEAWLVATNIQPEVRQWAKDASVKCLIWRERPQRLERA